MAVPLGLQMNFPGLASNQVVTGGGYTFTFTFDGNASTSTPLTDSITIRSQADFLAMGMSGQLDNTTAGGPVLSSDLIDLSATIQIVNTGSGNDIWTAPVAINSVVGTGQRPYNFRAPYFYKAQQTVQMNVTLLSVANLTSTDSYTLTILLDGMNLWLA
jgi:hypothetical protein